MELSEIREKIDAVDEQLLDLFLQRMDLSDEVAAYKNAHHLPILNKERERAILAKVTEKSGELLRGEEQVLMKMAREQDHPAKVKKEKKGRTGPAAGAEFTQAEETLFEKLRALRAEIAREEKVPPYIVFSDKTLTHMCILKPGTKAEMLEVSGVGAFKYDKYGERFLECVKV